MTDSLIWLHEDALRVSHPVFSVAAEQSAAVFIWDDKYLQEANYSLKRLVFLYETLCELPIAILCGDTVEILSAHMASQIYVPASPNPWIHSVCQRLAGKSITFIDEEPFVNLKTDSDFKRFHQFWNKAEPFAFLHNGGSDH